MASGTTVDEVVRLAASLSALEKLRVIERLAPQLEDALGPVNENVAEASGDKDDQYQRGYEQTPEDISELEALIPHLPLPSEQWE